MPGKKKRRPRKRRSVFSYWQPPSGLEKSNFYSSTGCWSKKDHLWEKRTHQYFLLICVNAYNGPTVFSTNKVNRDKLIKKNHPNFRTRDYSPQIGITFYKENTMHIYITFGIRGEIEPKNGRKAMVTFGAFKKTIIPIRGPSRILLYHRGASFNLTLSKLVNSPFKLRIYFKYFFIVIDILKLR